MIAVTFYQKVLYMMSNREKVANLIVKELLQFLNIW